MGMEQFESVIKINMTITSEHSKLRSVSCVEMR